MRMKAVVIHEPGGPEVLKIEERLAPNPKPGWVLIRVRAFPLEWPGSRSGSVVARGIGLLLHLKRK